MLEELVNRDHMKSRKFFKVENGREITEETWDCRTYLMVEIMSIQLCDHPSSIPSQGAGFIPQWRMGFEKVSGLSRGWHFIL